MIGTRGHLFAVAMWAFLLTMTCGSGYAIWLGTSFFPALKQAKMEFGAVLANEDVAAYPHFAAGVLDTWPERLAAFPADWAGALRTAFFVVIGVLLYGLHHRAPKGVDLDAANRGEPHRVERLAKARALSHYDGRLMRRTDGRSTASGTRRGVYLSDGTCELLGRWTQTGVAERIAFIIVHERAHIASADNALWSLGTINALLIAGLVTAPLVQPILYAAMIAIPDEAVRALPYDVTIGLATMSAVVCMAAIGSLSAGLLATLTAVREFFADSAAAAAVGRAHHPYLGTEEPGLIGDMAEAWNPGTAPPDRRLHLRGLSPRTGALAAFAIGVWVLVRTGLAIVSGLHYGLAAASFDGATAAALVAMLGALPRRCAGARSYDALPWAVTLLVIAVLAAAFVSIDGFATLYGLAPPFAPASILTMFGPIVGAVLGALLWLRFDRQPAVEADGIDARTARPVLAIPLLFLASSPAWVVSYVTAGLCLFVISGAATDFAVGDPAGWTRIIDLVTSAACCAFFYLTVVNIKRPGRGSIIAETVLSIVFFTAAYYLSMAIYGLLADGAAAIAGDALQRRLLAPSSDAMPSWALLIGFSTVLSLSWWARSALKGARLGSEGEP